MGKAYRTDAVEAPPLAAEIETLLRRDDILPPEAINCPANGCNVTYQLYNYMFSDRRANRETLLYGLRVHHPHHPARFVLNEPRATQD